MFSRETDDLELYAVSKIILILAFAVRVVLVVSCMLTNIHGLGLLSREKRVLNTDASPVSLLSGQL